jgi:hypothetical protein
VVSHRLEVASPKERLILRRCPDHESTANAGNAARFEWLRRNGFPTPQLASKWAHQNAAPKYGNRADAELSLRSALVRSPPRN